MTDQKTEIWALKDIKGWDKNPRGISKEGVKRLKNQIKSLGQYKPIIVNTNSKVAPVGAVAGGNMRLMAMTELGFEKVWVIPKHFESVKEMIEVSLSDNDRAGYYETEGLVSLVTGTDISLGDYSVDLREPPNLDLIVKNYGAPNTNDDAAPELPVRPKSKRGYIYKLGDHRLMCGDSTSQSDFEKLMDGQIANLIFTDPPYNVDYKSPAGLTYKSKKFRGTEGKIFNDNLSDEKYVKFLNDVLKNLFKFSTEHASIYWWLASRNYHLNYQAFVDTGFTLSQWLIWVKNSMILSRQDYHRCFEPCLFGWKKGQTHYTNKNIANLKDVFSDFKNNEEALKEWLSQKYVEEFDIWFEHRDATAKYVHPTQKPVALAERAIKKNSVPGQIVVDAFGGSGSTLIAAHKLSRRAFLMEMDPAYVDVIVKRWEEYTAEKAVLCK
jgi:DNA modification methylase